MALKYRVITQGSHMTEDELKQQWREGYELVSVCAWAWAHDEAHGTPPTITGPEFIHTLVYRGGLGATGAVRRR